MDYAYLIGMACWIGIPISIDMVVFYWFRWMISRIGEMSVLPPDESIPKNDQERIASDWANENGWTPSAGFCRRDRISLNHGKVWLHNDEAIRLGCITVQAVEKKVSSLVFTTVFDDGFALVTGVGSGMHIYPARPGTYRQSLGTDVVDELWKYHKRGIEYIGHATTKKPMAQIEPSIERYQEVNELDCTWIRSLRFWPFRAAYWLFLRSNRWHELSIEDQHKRGMIRFPDKG